MIAIGEKSFMCGTPEVQENYTDSLAEIKYGGQAHGCPARYKIYKCVKDIKRLIKNRN